MEKPFDWLWKQLGEFKGVVAVIVVTIVLTLSAIPWVTAYQKVPEHEQRIQKLEQRDERLKQAVDQLNRTVRLAICLGQEDLERTIYIRLDCNEFEPLSYHRLPVEDIEEVLM